MLNNMDKECIDDVFYVCFILHVQALNLKLFSLKAWISLQNASKTFFIRCHELTPSRDATAGPAPRKGRRRHEAKSRPDETTAKTEHQAGHSKTNIMSRNMSWHEYTQSD